MPVKPNLQNQNKASDNRHRHPDRRSKVNRKGSRRLTGRRRGSTIEGAKNRLRQFKQASLVAIAFTGFLILLFNPAETGYSQSSPSDTLVSPADDRQQEVNQQVTSEEITQATRNEALVTLQNLKNNFYANLPKILVALVTLLLAWVIIRMMRFVFSKTIKNWKTYSAITALTSISIWLLATGVAVSVLAGDIRALVGSLGLVGLALSWSLQTPIESFTGWLLNSFRRYYKIGDRIQVGEVFGDVYKIDFLTTTVWEIGAPYRQGFVMAEQPTGRLVTFPNNEILSGSIVNLTGDFPFVWDELTIAVANESEIKYAMEVVKKTAGELLGDYMKLPAQKYEKILQKAGLNSGIAGNPQVYVSANESWTDIIVRYLVGASERRKWKSELTVNMMEELNKKTHKDKIRSVYPRKQVQLIDEAGAPMPGKVQ